MVKLIMKGNDMNCLRTVEGKSCKGIIMDFRKYFYSFETGQKSSIKYYKCRDCRKTPLRDQQIILGLNKKGEEI